MNLSNLVFKYYEYQACIQPISTILVRVVKGRKDLDKDLIAVFNNNKEVFKKILRIHDCNSLIMSSLLATIYNIIDFLEPDTLFSILSFQRLREVFGIFKLNGFEQIHEVILHLVKGILFKKNEQNKNINESGTNTTSITDEEYNEIITVFSVALQFMRNKIVTIEFVRLAKWMSTLMAHMYTICSIINNTNLKTKHVTVLMEKRITDWLVECLNSLNERGVFAGINTAFESNDLNLVNTKVMIFRTFYHCFILIKNIRDLNSTSLVNFLII
jgi:hypothetical protein